MSHTYQTLLASVLFVLLQANSASPAVPLARVTPNTTDVIVVTKPHFRGEEQHGMEIANEHGRIGNQWFVYLDFKIGRKTYSAWWSSHTFGAPVPLDDHVRYKFLLRLERRSSECQIVKIWRDDKLIWKNRWNRIEA